MKAAIFGCGPAGLLAAHACNLQDIDFKIFSKNKKSELYGSQYLHEPIPFLTRRDDEGVPVKYIVRGTPENYRRKVHGKWWGGQVDPEEFQQDHTAWDIRHMYDVLWSMYSPWIEGYTIQSGGMAYEIANRELELEQYDLVISTVPRNIWAVEGEEYIYSEGWAMGDAPDRALFVEEELALRVKNNFIICDGTKDVSYTRLSKVYGHTTVEWPHHAPKPHPRAVMVRKPLRYKPGLVRNPTANWLHVGRYGKFHRGVVVSDAFNDTIAEIKKMRG